MALVIGQRGTGGGSVIQQIKEDSTTVPASGVKVIDTISTSVYNTIKWFIAVKIPTEGKYNSREVYARHNGTSVEYLKGTDVIGDPIKCKVIVDLLGGLMRLNIDNNETVELDVSYIRLPPF